MAIPQGPGRTASLAAIKARRLAGLFSLQSSARMHTLMVQSRLDLVRCFPAAAIGQGALEIIVKQKHIDK